MSRRGSNIGALALQQTSNGSNFARFDHYTTHTRFTYVTGGALPPDAAAYVERAEIDRFYVLMGGRVYRSAPVH
jgi:hypothetical protein